MLGFLTRQTKPSIWAPSQKEFKDERKSQPRRRKSFTRDSQATQKILDYLRQHEGEEITINELSEALGMTNASNAGYHIIKLMKSGAITRKGTKAHYTYKVNRATAKKRKYVRRDVETKRVEVPGKYKVKLTKMPTSTTLETQRRILGYIASHQGEVISQPEISKALGIPQSTVALNIRRMEARKVLSRTGGGPHGGGSRYTLYVEVDTPVNTKPKHVPTESVPVRKSSYEEDLIREFLEFWKNRKG